MDLMFYIFLLLTMISKLFSFFFILDVYIFTYVNVYECLYSCACVDQRGVTYISVVIGIYPLPHTHTQTQRGGGETDRQREMPTRFVGVYRWLLFLAAANMYQIEMMRDKIKWQSADVVNLKEFSSPSMVWQCDRL